MPASSPAITGAPGPNRSEGLAQGEDFLYGDVKQTGTVTASDAYLAQLFYLGKQDLAPQQQKAADVNGDGVVDATDALLIQKKALGEIDKFPVEKDEREPQKVRDLRADIASLKMQIMGLRPFGDLPPWRRKRLVRASGLADEADRLVEKPGMFSDANEKYQNALRLFRKDAPPEGGSGGDPGKDAQMKKAGSDGSGEGSSGEESMFAGVSTTGLVFGAGVLATGLIAVTAGSGR